MVQEFISVTAEVRRMARNVVPADFSTEQIEPYQKRAFSFINMECERSGDPKWDTDEVAYGSAVMCETLIAAVFLLNHETGGGSELPAIQQLWDEAKLLLYGDPENGQGGLVNNASGSSGGGGGSASQEIELVPFRDWHNNLSVPVPNKLTRKYLGSGTGGVEGKTT